ncbi:MAG TPA: hypothetical protein VF679_01015, partial [Pedobacter sp.]
NHITIGGKSFSAPSCWEEFSERDLKLWVKILSKDIEPFEAFQLAAAFLYKIPKRWYFKLNTAQQYDLNETLIFLWAKDSAVEWIIPYFKMRWRKYIGPDSRLSNITIKEYRSCEIYNTLYQRTKEARYLDMLIATLYRRPGANDSGNDEREKLTDLKVRKNAAKMNRLSEPLRQAILFNYEACSVYIQSKYPYVFKKSGKKADNSLPDLEEHIKIVAGGKFGNFKETELTPVYLFLDHLNRYIEESEKSK